MFEKLKKLKALSGAERALESRGRISKAIAAEEVRLLKLITERVEADHAAIKAETGATLGEESDVSGARKRVDSVMLAISRQAAVLGGLRARMAGQAAELEGEVRAITAALPEHISGLKSDFESTWRRGAAAFGKLLGERRAIEELTGKMELPNPEPVAVELEAAGEPWQAIEALKAGLTEITGWSSAATWPVVDAMTPGGVRPFDAMGVYVLMRDCDHLKAGTLVMQSVLVPGFLQHLVNIQYAELLTDQQWRSGLEAGRQAAFAIESQAQRDASRKAEAEQAAAIQAMPTPPIAGQRPANEDTQYLRDQRDLAAGHRSAADDWPENIGTVVG